MYRLSILSLALVMMGLVSNVSFGASKTFQLPGFDNPFRATTERNQPGGFKTDKDPVDETNLTNVFKFSVVPRKCFKDDCLQQSARATVEQVEGKQPAEAWYGWDIYFVPGFPTASNQVPSLEIFTEFKDTRKCLLVGLTTKPNGYDPFLSWSMQKPTGKEVTADGGDCIDISAIRVAAIKDLEGAWHRFELYAKWDKGNEGKFQMFIDGKQVMDYSGITCFSCDKLNYFLFGNYICCTPGTEQIVPSTVYYRFVSRAKRREDLVWK
jgi:hypothetical protein